MRSLVEIQLASRPALRDNHRMHIEHMALWARDLERLKRFYCEASGASVGPRYDNPRTDLSSYFLTFAHGTRLELMHRPDLGEARSDQALGWAHVAVAVSDAAEVDALTARLQQSACSVVSPPRRTGDGYYESCVADPEGNRVEIVAAPDRMHLDRPLDAETLRDYLVSTRKAAIDLDTVHAFLTQSYWKAGISRVDVQAAIDGAICFGVYYQPTGAQVGFARVITDFVTFAYLADVFVTEAHRGRGVSVALVRQILSHPGLAGVSKWLLGTRDAHGLYARFGFAAPAHPERSMERRSATFGALRRTGSSPRT